MKITLILTCAGKGERAGFGKNKLLVTLAGGKTVLQTALDKFIESGKIDEYIVTANEQDIPTITELIPTYCKIVVGGSTRTQSVKNALAVATGDVVLIHDGARPYVTQRVIDNCVSSAIKFGGTVPVVPCRDTVLKGDKVAIDYLGKSGLYSVQTPQAFKTELIKKAYALAKDETFNDDGEVFKEYIGELALCEGDFNNVKLTFQEDFSPTRRAGVGFDCHRLVEGRKLILGGITIPHDKGLLGHSDADVLTHAIMDAILSACAMRDIGYHFPDKDPQYKGADSVELLKRVLQIIAQEDYKVYNISATIMAEKPKLLNHIPQITKNLATVLDLPTDRIGIGATTLEGLGFVGREEGICVHATATVIK